MKTILAFALMALTFPALGQSIEGWLTSGNPGKIHVNADGSLNAIPAPVATPDWASCTVSANTGANYYSFTKTNGQLLAAVPGKKIVVVWVRVGVSGNLTGTNSALVALADGYKTMTAAAFYPYLTQNIAQSTGGYNTGQIVYDAWRGMPLTVGNQLRLLIDGTVTAGPGGMVNAFVAYRYE